jgi:hypothetical protein
MLRKAKNLYGFSIETTDGVIGKVDEFLFNDATWKIRYLVVETGPWLLARKVLIPPVSLCPPNEQMSVFPVKLTKEQVSNSPDIDTNKPVSLQHQSIVDTYYQPIFFSPLGMTLGAGVMSLPVQMPRDEHKEASKSHLRCTRHVVGYHIQAPDGQCGDVDDFIFDDENWTVRYLVMDTSIWLPGKSILIPASHISRVDWEARTVHTNLSCNTIRNAPQYRSLAPIERKYENQLSKYYADTVSKNEH